MKSRLSESILMDLKTNKTEKKVKKLTESDKKYGFVSDVQGTCPKCGTDGDLDYGQVEFEGDMLYFPWECPHCGATGNEWYDATFTGHYVDTDDGIVCVADYIDNSGKPINEAAETNTITAEDFLNSEIDVYDLAPYAENKDFGHGKGIIVIDGEEVPITAFGNEYALLKGTDGKYILSDYEAIRQIADNENDKSFSIPVGKNHKGESNKGPYAAFDVMSLGHFKATPKDIIDNAPSKKMKARDFFTKYNYNARCENNFAGLIDNLNGKYNKMNESAKALKENATDYKELPKEVQDELLCNDVSGEDRVRETSTNAKCFDAYQSYKDFYDNFDVDNKYYPATKNYVKEQEANGASWNEVKKNLFAYARDMLLDACFSIY